jgi:hypothetical protein
MVLVPHGKTTMSPELFQIQLDEGAWGITFATVGQLATGVATGVRRALLANQVLLPHDLSWLNQLHTSHPDLQAPFLLDSATQLTAIESWMAQAQTHATPPRPFEVLIELGLPAGRTGCRTLTQALDLAQAAHASPAVRLVGIECYEGLWAKADTTADRQLVDTLMQQVHDLAQTCDRAGLFNDTPEVWISAGGSAVFDLVASWLTPVLSRQVLGSAPIGLLHHSRRWFLQTPGAFGRRAIGHTRPAGSALALRRWTPRCPGGLVRGTVPSRATPGHFECGEERPVFRYGATHPTQVEPCRQHQRARRSGRMAYHPTQRPARVPEHGRHEQSRANLASGRSRGTGHFAPLHHL